MRSLPAVSTFAFIALFGVVLCCLLTDYLSFEIFICSGLLFWLLLFWGIEK